jgi:SPP1 gp7 family putative phage head morphogenesis protein
MSAQKEFEKIIFAFAVEAAAQGGQEAVDRVEYGNNFHFEDEDALRYLLENAIQLSETSIARLTGNINEVIQTGVREGKSIREISKDVRGIFDNFSGYEAERIARTEVARATNAGAISGYKSMGIEIAEVVANAGACPICAARNGELRPTDQAMQDLPRHPNCYCFWIPRPDLTKGDVA